MSSINIHIPNITVYNPDIIHKVQEFHRSLTTLQNVLCNVCLEQFLTLLLQHTVAIQLQDYFL